MSKKFTKITVLCLIMFMICNVSACGLKSNGGDDDDGTQYPPLAGSISVCIFEAGYGTQWLTDMAKAFRRKTGIRVNVSKSYLGGEIDSMIDGGTAPYDIVFALSSSFYRYQDRDLLAELSDVYNAVPEGESKPIKEKMNTNIYNKLLDDENKIYQMSWVDSMCSLMYNKTTLDNVFGADNYTVPRTTDELYEFAQAIEATKKAYPFVFSTQDLYLIYGALTWWAQYDGYEKYYDYYQGYYTKEDGTKAIALNGENMDSPGRKKSLEVCAKLYAKSAGFTHNSAASMTYAEAQTAFVGQGYKGRDLKEVAMMTVGDWVQNEMGIYLAQKPQELRMMRTPIISSIVEQLEDKNMSDAKLRELVDAIDAGETSCAGVSDNDFARVKEARMMACCANFDHPVAIPKTSAKQDLAKKFLVFMASDEGQKIYADTLGGLTQCYGYKPDATGLSGYTLSRRNLFENYLPICLDTEPELTRNGFSAFYTQVINAPLYNGDSPDDILAVTKTQFMTDWKNTIALAKPLA